eukprot:TRINITY_DN25563_c0_g1_i1.p1 TRINITY_DN25563_c0_g1~~TRINITY_DN25563_c0_g1_i1.p1  ORF type:complete len:422 (-),score=57.59 TRINITY_DN25563_c0_g1_i1:60-1265(-)
MCIRDRLDSNLGAQRCSKSKPCPNLYKCNERLKICQHKEIFPLTMQEIFGSLLVIVVAGLANAGGLGGGAIITPILIIFFEYRASASIMISYILVFGGSLGNFFLSGLAKDPETGRRVVNYDLALLCLPLLLMGTLIGLKINRAMPEIAIIGLLVCLIVFLLQKVSVKAWSVYSKENVERDARKSLVEKQKKTTNNLETPTSLDTTREESNDELTQLLVEEKNVFPIKKMVSILTLVVIIIIISVIKGSQRFPSALGVDFCGFTYWTLLVLAVVICFLFYLHTSREVSRTYAIKERLGFPFEDEFRLNRGNVSKISLYSAIAGVLAGLAGIGGGMVMSPLLLEYGLRPQSASATSSLTVVFTSFISLTLALLNGFVEYDQVVWFFLLSAVGAFIVLSLIHI